MVKFPDTTEASTQSEQSSSILTVTQLNRLVRNVLEDGFSGIWVSGEISDLSQPSSGHMYFSLKDEQATVRCAMFRNKQRGLGFKPENGIKVEVRGDVSLYEARGSYQLIASVMKPAGIGQLYVLFEKLKKRLHAEGLFDESRKQTIPAFPQTIGIVTSTSGAAIRDALIVLQRRFPMGQVIVYPTLVQGAEAAAAIAAAIATAGRRAECDVLILTRGGGSLEDLWSFNEEIVARAIHACPLPVISGVGHEVDTTIADLVADQRAPTPSAAAELVSPDQEMLWRQVQDAKKRLLDTVHGRLNHDMQHSQRLRQRIRDPERMLDALRQRLDEAVMRLRRQGEHCVENGYREWKQLHHRLRMQYPEPEILRQRVSHLRRRLARAGQRAMEHCHDSLKHQERALRAVNPKEILARGYAIIRLQDGTVVRSYRQLTPDETLQVVLSEGGASVITRDVSE